MKTSPGLPILLALSACSLTPAPVDYYQGRGDPPSVDDVQHAGQAGNISGPVVTISGSGFGDDAAKVMVQFGGHNATITAVSDSELTVVAPAGPVGGGAVPVIVGTYAGYASGQYIYDLGDAVAAGDGQGTEGQVGYVLVNNYWESCFGGLSSRLADTYSGNFTDCQSLSYIGQSGLTGSAEAVEFAVERLHAGSQGWSGAADMADGEWRVERPSETPYVGGLDDFHVDLGNVSITNDFWKGENGYCVDLAETASFRYGGGEEDYEAPTTVSGTGFPVVTPAGAAQDCEANEEYYAPDTLEFCSREDAQGIDSHVYEADWPVDENFFASHKRKQLPSDVVLHLPDVGVADVALSLPQSMVVYNTEGYDDVFTNTAGDTPGAQDVWGAYGSMQHCFDEKGKSESLDDIAFTFEWPVSTAEIPEVGGDILGVRTYVRATITELSVGWFGGLNNPVRATITVPDTYNTHTVDGPEGKEERSQLEIPSSVMYQFPSIKFPNGSGFGGAGYVVPGPDEHLGYMFIEFQRVTEYTVQTDAGPVVFAYVTGDFGFTDWTNPTDDACHDCLDNDGDGWTDDKDPDCASGIEEVGGGDSACSDGLDNDGDGLVDSEDAECADSADPDESNCDDNKDNDGDGFKDDADADCKRGDNETLPDGCVDGLDNDADGWVDGNDPDCVSGDSEEGVGTASCNDGVDDDGDGLIDADDPDCTSAGATELGAAPASCSDGVDDDGDGWTDAADPDCTTGDATELGFGLTQCNDGIDNDLDAAADALDPDCVDAADADEAI